MSLHNQTFLFSLFFQSLFFVFFVFFALLLLAFHFLLLAPHYSLPAPLPSFSCLCFSVLYTPPSTLYPLSSVLCPFVFCLPSSVPASPLLSASRSLSLVLLSVHSFILYFPFFTRRPLFFILCPLFFALYPLYFILAHRSPSFVLSRFFCFQPFVLRSQPFAPILCRPLVFCRFSLFLTGLFLFYSWGLSRRAPIPREGLIPRENIFSFDRSFLPFAGW